MHATEKDHMWQADSASMFTFGGGWFLIAVDVFTRFTRAAPMANTTAAEAVRVFRTWDPPPQILDTDGGREFKDVFHDHLEKEGIQHQVRSGYSINALAVADRKIQQLKKAISGAMMEDETAHWIRLVPDIVTGLNESPTEALHGKAPEDIQSEEAIFDIQKAQAERAEKSTAKFDKQVSAVERVGQCEQ